MKTEKPHGGQRLYMVKLGGHGGGAFAEILEILVPKTPFGTLAVNGMIDCQISSRHTRIDRIARTITMVENGEKFLLSKITGPLFKSHLTPASASFFHR